MRVEQFCWSPGTGWHPTQPGRLGQAAQLVLVFGGTAQLNNPQALASLRQAYPGAQLFGCSTAGEIYGEQVSSDSLTATAIQFEHTRIAIAHVGISAIEASFQAGAQLAQALDQADLAHVFVLSDGITINGSALIAGLASRLPPGVTVTGGLSGDGERFEQTLVLADGAPASGLIAGLGLYGRRLKVGYGSLGGWDPFGPERLITRSQGNVLYELDGRSALELYKKYLGEYADGLPAAGLLFPLSLRTQSGEAGVVRTILSIDEIAQSMTFAGDMPEGAHARLMKANFDRLIDGAIGAAKTSYQAIGATSPDLAILISCVGRRMLLKQRIEEEVEGVRDVLGQRTIMTGFYSYGEISPFTPNASCELHNQTMTITALSED